MTRPISDLDVPLTELQQLLARQRNCQTLADAAAHSHSPSDRIAYALDAWLITHSDAPVATVADYPVWAAEMAARENANREVRNARRKVA
ncbi:hypothetical protein [Streptomyces triticiradicis]|uniref:Uncharacterized protein n=1 Tax=Streptomyces triticiradicis TaxID=2651189 RepID=A0A7J5D749_9ACTN|nr:hypothetical protein [Streptomyces triticiradicis]KAB1979268.1 hypothetical protein F8144_36500 [Streptomyces triticiradicis]